MCVYMMCLPKAEENIVLTWPTSFSPQVEMFDCCGVQDHMDQIYIYIYFNNFL